MGEILPLLRPLKLPASIVFQAIAKVLGIFNIQEYLWYLMKFTEPFLWGNSATLSIFGLEGSWGQPQGPNFPSPWAIMLALRLDCSTVALTTPQKVLPIWKLVELKMLDFSDRTRTGISILTSVGDQHWAYIASFFKFQEIPPSYVIVHICSMLRSRSDNMLFVSPFWKKVTVR